MNDRQREAREPQAARFIEAGRVPCPRFADADLEQCYVCGYLRSMHGEPPEWVECTYREGIALAGMPSLIASRQT
jgi:hypothetical protein